MADKGSRSGKRIVLVLGPFVFLAVLILPVFSGFLGTLGPAFGYLPVLGGNSVSLFLSSAFLKNRASTLPF